MTRIGVLFTLAFVLSARGAIASDDAESPRAFVEWRVDPPEAVVGEATRIALRVGLDATWPTWLVPTIARRLDLPVGIDAPAFGSLPGKEIGANRSTSLPRATVAIGDRVVEGERSREERDGVVYDVVTVTSVRRLEDVGTFELAAPRVILRHTAEWKENLVGSRVPGATDESRIDGSVARLVVHEPPEAQRPAGWIDAVGTFEVAATVETLPAPPERALRWTLRIRGDGNLESMTPPPRGGMPGFHVLGRLDSIEGGERIVRLDLVAVDPAVEAIPAIELVWYDPATREYGTSRTDALPLPSEVRPDAGAEASEREPSTFDAKGPWLVACAGLLVGMLLGTFALRARRRRSSTPSTTGAADALAALRSGIASHSPELDVLLAAWLGAIAGTPTHPSQEALIAAGFPAPVASRALVMLSSLRDVRFGGPPPTLDAAWVDEIARHAP